MGFESDKPSFVSHFIYLLTMCSWKVDLTSLSLSFLVYIVEIMKHPSQGSAKIKLDKIVRHLVYKRHPTKVTSSPPSLACLSQLHPALYLTEHRAVSRL